MLQGQREDERLGDRLDAELRLVVADGEHAPSWTDDRERQAIGVRARELGDVLRRLTGVEGAHVVEDAVQELHDGVHDPTLAGLDIMDPCPGTKRRSPASTPASSPPTS